MYQPNVQKKNPWNEWKQIPFILPSMVFSRMRAGGTEPKEEPRNKMNENGGYHKKLKSFSIANNNGSNVFIAYFRYVQEIIYFLPTTTFGST